MRSIICLQNVAKSKRCLLLILVVFFTYLALIQMPTTSFLLITDDALKTTLLIEKKKKIAFASMQLITAMPRVKSYQNKFSIFFYLIQGPVYFHWTLKNVIETCEIWIFEVYFEGPSKSLQCSNVYYLKSLQSNEGAIKQEIRFLNCYVSTHFPGVLEPIEIKISLSSFSIAISIPSI